MSYTPTISSEAVVAKTGHDWNHWFKLLDGWGAKQRTHREIAAYLREEVGLSGWWSQMVTGEYEKSRGLRAATGQQCDTDKFQAQVQRTVAAPVEAAYRAFAASKQLGAWMGPEASIEAKKGGVVSLPGLGKGELRIVERNKRLRMGFNGRGATQSTLEITFDGKGPDKCAVRLQHINIASEAAYERFKKGWTRTLDALKAHLADGS